MSVPKGKRNESKVEFDNTYYKIHKDAVKLCCSKFGATKEQIVEYNLYINAVISDILDDVLLLGKYIRMANSIYPKYEYELSERRLLQNKSIGMCFSILTKYQLVMEVLGTHENKYVNEINNLTHEINCLKKWRLSDNKRFNNLG